MVSIPNKETVAARKEITSRSCYNDWVWNRFLDRKAVDRKLQKGFIFHHQISTNGVSTSILYLRPKSASSKTRDVTFERSQLQQQQQQQETTRPTRYPRKWLGSTQAREMWPLWQMWTEWPWSTQQDSLTSRANWSGFAGCWRKKRKWLGWRRNCPSSPTGPTTR